MLGFLFRSERTNNTELLQSTKYNLATSFTRGDQTAKTTEDIEAYKEAEYGEFTFRSIYIDLMRYIPLWKDSAVIAMNVYYRHRNSSNETFYPTYSDIGITTAFFKSTGKFAGGIYLELPDINEKIASRDPLYETRPWSKRMNFGVYAKLSFTSFLRAL